MKEADQLAILKEALYFVEQKWYFICPAIARVAIQKGIAPADANYVFFIRDNFPCIWKHKPERIIGVEPWYALHNGHEQRIKVMKQAIKELEALF